MSLVKELEIQLKSAAWSRQLPVKEGLAFLNRGGAIGKPNMETISKYPDSFTSEKEQETKEQI